MAKKQGTRRIATAYLLELAVSALNCNKSQHIFLA